MKKFIQYAALSASLVSAPAMAGEVGDVTTFSAGTPAKAAEVNNNFSALISAINDNAGRITALEDGVADPSVAGSTYRVFSLNNELANDDTTFSDGNNSANFLNVLFGSGDFTLVFNELNGAGTFTINEDSHYEANLPSYKIEDYSDYAESTSNLTFTQTGTLVTMSVEDGDEIYNVELIASKDGSMIIGRTVEVIDEEFGGGTPGSAVFIELLVGIRQ